MTDYHKETLPSPGFCYLWSVYQSTSDRVIINLYGDLQLYHIKHLLSAYRKAVHLQLCVAGPILSYSLKYLLEYMEKPFHGKG